MNSNYYMMFILPNGCDELTHCNIGDLPREALEKTYNVSGEDIVNSAINNSYLGFNENDDEEEDNEETLINDDYGNLDEIVSDININMDKINNKEIILTHDQSNKKKRFLQRANSSGNNKINSYQNYLIKSDKYFNLTIFYF